MIRSSVTRSFHLLTKSEKRIYILFVIRQCLTSTLDLLALLTLGIVASIVIDSENTKSSAVGKLLRLLHLHEMSQMNLLIIFLSLTMVLFLLKGILALANLYGVLTQLNLIAVKWAQSCLDAIYKREVTFLNFQPTQRLAYSISPSANAAFSDILGNFVIIVGEISLVVGLAIALIVISPTIAIVSFVYFGLVAVMINKFLGSKARESSRLRSQNEILGNSWVIESTMTFREVLIANRQDFYRRNFELARKDSSLAHRTAQFVGAVPKYAFELALIVGTALTSLIAFKFNSTQTALTISGLFLATGSRAMPSLLRLQGAMNNAQNGIGIATSFFALLDELERTTPPEVSLPDRQDARPARHSSEIDLQNVSYRYSGATDYTIKNVSLHIDAGQSVALVGPSGAGKSTLADLMLGALFPESGTVTIGGLPPRQAVETWPGQIAYVPQNVGLRDGTVTENVALGWNPDEVDDDQIWQALEYAGLKQLFVEHPLGLKANVGERGLLLSGGQRQRLGLARALYTNPQLLILDEATSALDAETEHAIAQAMQKLKNSVTTVTIAHRLATVTNADLVVYLEEGQILAQGSFQQVRDAIPRFNRQANLLGIENLS